MIHKIYIFQFVNNYISCFVFIFYFQDFKKLQTQLITTMVIKQFFIVAAEYAARKLLTHVQRKRVEKSFAEKLESIDKKDLVTIADLNLHKNVE